MANAETKRLVAVGLLAIFLLSLAPASSMGAQADLQRANEFLSIAAKVRDEVTRVRNLVASRGVDTSSAEALIRDGDALLADARAAIDRNDPQAAMEKVRMAQERYRDAVRTMSRPLVERAEVSAQERARSLDSAISRTQERIQRIRDVVGMTPNLPPSIAANVNNNLTIAEKALGDARSALASSPPDTQAAAKGLGDASKALAQALSSLEKAANERQAKRAANFLASMMRIVDTIRGQLTRASQAGVAVDDLQNELNSVDSLLGDAKQKIDSRDTKGAIEDFKKARKLIVEIRQELARRAAK